MSNQPKYVLVKTGSGSTAALCRLINAAHNQSRTEYEQVAHGDTPDMRILFRDLTELSAKAEPADLPLCTSEAGEGDRRLICQHQPNHPGTHWDPKAGNWSP